MRILSPSSITAPGQARALRGDAEAAGAIAVTATATMIKIKRSRKFDFMTRSGVCLSHSASITIR